MKLLIIASYLPYPLDSGGHVRLYNLLKQLSVHHAITLICEIRPNQTMQDKKEVEKICQRVITVPRKKQWSIQNILRSGVSKHSFLVTGHTSELMKKAIREELTSTSYDLIHVETYYVMQNIPQDYLLDPKSGKRVPVILTEHNIEYTVYEKFASKLPSYFRPLFYLDIAKIKREEETNWKNAQSVLAVSHEDMLQMQKSGIKPQLVPNGVNTREFIFKPKQLSASTVRQLLFLGNFQWIQNVDACSYLITEIWPEIKKLHSKDNLKLWIVGRNIPQSLRKLTNDPDVLFDETSAKKSTPEIFQEADILLAPLRVGGGTSYKILEAMSSGTPVVTMPMSATAIGAVHNQSIVVADSANSFARETVALLDNKNRSEKIAKEARVLIEKKYTWEIIGKSLEKAYQEAVYN